MAGRNPKPTAAKVLAGESRPSRLNENEPKPEAGIPDCPPGMSELSKAYWDYYAPILDRMRILTEADMSILEAFCKICAEAITFEKVLEKEGWYTDILKMDSLGNEIREKKVHPLAVRLEKRRDDIRHYTNLLGLNPSARARFSVPKEDAGDDFDKFMRAKSGK